MSAPTVPVPAAALETAPTFTVGGALSRTFAAWTANLPLFLFVSALFHLPMLYFVLSPVPGWKMFAAIPVQAVLGVLSTSIIIRAVYENLRGGRATVGETLQMGLRVFGRVFTASLRTGLMVFLMSLLLVVPGIVWMCRLYVAAPAAAVEADEATDALDRSKQLTDGYRWSIFGLFVIGAFAALGLGAALGALTRAEPQVTQAIVSNLIPQALVNSFTAALNCVVYYQLRVVKEGLDLEQIAAVFE